MRSLILSSLTVAALLAASTAALAENPNVAFRDPLQTAAEPLSGALTASRQPVLALANIQQGARHRLVGVGLRGLILLSDDAGVSWRQAHVPVQSDLVSVCFVSAQEGWAVGHDGVILHSDDGGETWRKQFDGSMAHSALTSYYQERITNGEKSLKPFLDEVELNTQNGATLPFLSVYFENNRVGYAVGSFGMIVATDDGGTTWRPWLDHVDNDKFLNLNDIRAVGGSIYIVGEQGTVYKLDRKRAHFVSVSPDYKGSFFRIVGNDDFQLAVGLNGTAFRSGDGGRSWIAVVTGARTSLTSGTVYGNGQVLLTAEGGQLLYSKDAARSFTLLRPERPLLYADVTGVGGGWYVFSGYQGIERQMINPAPNFASVQK